MGPDLSIVIPAFNEAKCLPRSLEKILSYLEKRAISNQIIVVDDGGSDGTADMIACQFDGKVEVLRHESRLGKGAASRTGMLAATGRKVLVTDADLAIPIEELDRFLIEAENASVVIGSKYMASSQIHYPMARRIGSALGQACIKLLVVRGYRDTQCGFKLFDRSIGKRLLTLSCLTGYGYDFELLFLAGKYGIRVSELPVQVDTSVGSKVRLSSYLKTLGEALQVVGNRISRVYPKDFPKET